MARVYDTKRWLKVRALQLRREPLCRMCAALGHPVPAVDVDHVTPLAAGGAPFDFANLRSLCHEDHARVTAAARTGRPISGCAVDGTPLDPLHRWNVAKERNK